MVLAVFLVYAFCDTAWVVTAFYVLDQFVLNLTVCVNTYFQKIADPRDIAPSMAVGFTINHVAAVVIPVCGGLLWLWDYRLVFAPARSSPRSPWPPPAACAAGSGVEGSFLPAFCRCNRVAGRLKPLARTRGPSAARAAVRALLRGIPAGSAGLPVVFRRAVFLPTERK